MALFKHLSAIHVGWDTLHHNEQIAQIIIMSEKSMLMQIFFSYSLRIIWYNFICKQQIACDCSNKPATCMLKRRHTHAHRHPLTFGLALISELQSFTHQIPWTIYKLWRLCCVIKYITIVHYAQHQYFNLDIFVTINAIQRNPLKCRYHTTERAYIQRI